jgi:hypothetical protein
MRIPRSATLALCAEVNGINISPEKALTVGILRT